MHRVLIAACFIGLVVAQKAEVSHVLISTTNDDKTAQCNGVLIASDAVMTTRDCLVMLNYVDAPISVWTAGDNPEMRWVSTTTETESFQTDNDKLPTREFVILFIAHPFQHAGTLPPENWGVSDDVVAAEGDSREFWTIQTCAPGTGCRYTTRKATALVTSAPDWPYSGSTETLSDLEVTRTQSYEKWVGADVMCIAGCAGCPDYGAPVLSLSGKLTGLGRNAWCGTVDGNSNRCVGPALTVLDPDTTTKFMDDDGSFCTGAVDNWIQLSAEDQTWAEEWLANQQDGSLWSEKLPSLTECATTISTSSNERHGVDSFSVCLELKSDVDEIWVTLPMGFTYTDDTAVDYNRLWGVQRKPRSVELMKPKPGMKYPQIQLRWSKPEDVVMDSNTNRIIYFEVNNVRNPNNCDNNGEWAISQWNCKNSDLLNSGTTQVRRCPVSSEWTQEVSHGINTYPKHCNFCNACYAWTSDSDNNYIMKCEHDGVQFLRTTKKEDGELFSGENCYLNGISPLV